MHTSLQIVHRHTELLCVLWVEVTFVLRGNIWFMYFRAGNRRLKLDVCCTGVRPLQSSGAGLLVLQTLKERGRIKWVLPCVTSVDHPLCVLLVLQTPKEMGRLV